MPFGKYKDTSNHFYLVSLKTLQLESLIRDGRRNIVNITTASILNRGWEANVFLIKALYVGWS